MELLYVGATQRHVDLSGLDGGLIWRPTPIHSWAVDIAPAIGITLADRSRGKFRIQSLNKGVAPKIRMSVAESRAEGPQPETTWSALRAMCIKSGQEASLDCN